MKRFEAVTEEDLIAMHLRELAPARAGDVRRALAADAALAVEAAALLQTLETMKGVPLRVEAQVLNRNWEALRMGLVPHRPVAAAVPRWRMPAFAGLVLLSAAVVGYVVAAMPSAPVPVAAAAEPEPGERMVSGGNGGFGDAQGSGVQSNPEAGSGGRGGLSYRLGVPPRLGMGVFHPHGTRQGPVVRMLGLAQVQLPLTAEPRGPAFAAVAGERNQLAVEARPEGVAVQPAFVADNVGPGPLTVAPAGGHVGQGAGGVAAGRTGGAKRRRSGVETELSLGLAGQLTIPHASNFSSAYGSQSLDASPVVLGTVRQTFKPWLGYTVNLGYTRSTEQNRLDYTIRTQSGPVINQLPYDVNMYELSLAPTFRKRFSRKVSGFVNVGGGVLTFLPVHRGATAKDFTSGDASLVPSVLFRQLGVAAAGVDVKLTGHVGLRAEYRGMIFKYPDFGGRVGRALTETSEPAVSVTYRFGGGE